MHTTSNQADARVTELDGLRGVASLNVCVFHFLCMMSPSLAHNMAGQQSVEAIVHTPISALWNGLFAVTVFFVLSGFVIAAACERKNLPLSAFLALRYIRLAVPVTFSVLLAWCLLSLLPNAADALASQQREGSIWLQYTIQGDIPRPWWAIYDGLFGSFVTGGSKWNNVLWTMQYELLGSAAIIILYRLRNRHYRMAGLMAFAFGAVALKSPYYIAFAAGALIFEARRAGVFREDRPKSSLLAIALGLTLGSVTTGTPASYGVQLPDVPILRSFGYGNSVPMVVAACLIMLGTLTSPIVRGAMRMPASQWLGKVSFGLYLVHAPILYTLIASLEVRYGLGAVALLPLYLLVSLFAAWAMTASIESPLLRWLSDVSKRLEPRVVATGNLTALDTGIRTQSMI